MGMRVKPEVMKLSYSYVHDNGWPLTDVYITEKCAVNHTVITCLPLLGIEPIVLCGRWIGRVLTMC